tara:strand:+ start:927 stop:1187 length:261 start_codon:yes stop_codon:yes gene_type:complete
MIIVAGLGLNYSIYGIMVTAQNPSIYQIVLSDIDHENLIKNRHLEIKEAISIAEPLIYTDEYDTPIKYIHALNSKKIATKVQSSNN